MRLRKKLPVQVKMHRKLFSSLKKHPGTIKVVAPFRGYKSAPPWQKNDGTTTAVVKSNQSTIYKKRKYRGEEGTVSSMEIK